MRSVILAGLTVVLALRMREEKEVTHCLGPRSHRQAEIRSCDTSDDGAARIVLDRVVRVYAAAKTAHG